MIYVVVDEKITFWDFLVPRVLKDEHLENHIIPKFIVYINEDYYKNKHIIFKLAL